MDEREKLLRTIFLTARDIADAQQRAVYLAQACESDLALRSEIEELIQTQATPGELSSEPLGAHVREAALASIAEEPAPEAGPLRLPGTEQPGERIGRYK